MSNPVPERLIDANSINLDNIPRTEVGALVFLADVRQRIAEAPTIKRQAHWEVIDFEINPNGHDTYRCQDGSWICKCSNCNSISKRFSPYCPDCGYEMSGDVTDDQLHIDESKF